MSTKKQKDKKEKETIAKKKAEAKYGADYKIVENRIYERGWSWNDAISTPRQPRRGSRYERVPLEVAAGPLKERVRKRVATLCSKHLTYIPLQDRFDKIFICVVCGMGGPRATIIWSNDFQHQVGKGQLVGRPTPYCTSCYPRSENEPPVEIAVRYCCGCNQNRQCGKKDGQWYCINGPSCYQKLRTKSLGK